MHTAVTVLLLSWTTFILDVNSKPKKLFNKPEHCLHYRRNFVCDDGDLSPPLLKVVMTVTTTFSTWNLQENRIFLAPLRIPLGELTTLPQTL